jgi:CrcB protein
VSDVPRPTKPSGMGRDRRELLAIFAGGSLGAIARAGMGEWLPHETGTWPWATFAVNVAGAFLLGYFTTRLQERLPLSAYRRPLLGTGFCGALTTYSTFSWEILGLARRREILAAGGYALLSITAGMGAAVIGGALAVAVIS